MDIQKTYNSFISLVDSLSVDEIRRETERAISESRGIYLMKDNTIVEELVNKPITVDSVQRILNEYFDIPNNTYAYNLTRVKSAFEIGTMTFDDFEEFTEDTTRDLAEYIIKRFSE